VSRQQRSATTFRSDAHRTVAVISNRVIEMLTGNCPEVSHNGTQTL